MKSQALYAATIAAAAGVAGFGGGSAVAAVSTVQMPTPAIDRWMYVFAQNPGLEAEARVFSAFPYDHGYFDNRDGQFVVAWNTASPEIPAGLDPSRYRIISARVTARVSGNNYFRYDPSYDSYLTQQPSPPLPAPAGLTADADAGRPIEMFVAGYRGNWAQGPTASDGKQVFGQTSAYAVGAAFPAVANRSVFPGQYNTSGTLIDVSNNVDDGFEARPVAIGKAATNTEQPMPVQAGELVPLNTDMVFDVDLTQPEARDAIKAGLAGGRVSFVITSLALTEQASSIVPRFYTRQWREQYGTDPAANPPILELSVCVGPPTDWDCNGQNTIDDIFIFLNHWFEGNGDFNQNGVSSIDDIFIFLNAWFAG